MDGSGSMRGFEATGALRALVADLLAAGDAAGLPGLAKAFHADADAEGPTWTDWATWQAAPTFGQTTPLDAALRATARDARVAVLVTDNFQDPFGSGGGAAGTTEAFYATLAGLPLHRVWLAPTLARFDGQVDLALPPGDADALHARVQAHTPLALRAGGQIGRPRWTGGAHGFWKVRYQGRRGLAIYLLQAHAADAPALDAFRAALAARRPDWTPLLVRPLGGETLTLRPAARPAPDPRAAACAGAAPPAGAPLRLVDGPHGPWLTGGPLDPRAPQRLTAWLDLVAPAGHLSVSGELGGCGQGAAVRVVDATVRPRPGFEALAAPTGPVQASVWPPESLGPLAPEAPGDRALALTVDLPAQLSDRVPRPRTDRGLDGAVSLEIALPAGAMTLSRAVAEQFFTAEPTDLARLYSPRDIVQALAAGPISVRLTVGLDPAIWASPPAAAEAPPAPDRWPWALGLLAALLAAGLATRPYGFVAPLQVVGDHYVHGVRLRGLLRATPAGRIALPDGGVVHVARASLWRRRVRLLHGEVAVPLAPARQAEIAGARVQWLDRQARRDAIARGAYDPHAGG